MSKCKSSGKCIVGIREFNKRKIEYKGCCLFHESFAHSSGTSHPFNVCNYSNFRPQKKTVFQLNNLFWIRCKNNFCCSQLACWARKKREQKEEKIQKARKALFDAR